MKKKNLIALLLILTAVSGSLAELYGWLLPTISWPFTVSREMNLLSLPAEACPLAAADGRVHWFGWLCMALIFAAGVYLLVSVLLQQVMDAAAITICRENKVPSIRVFGLDDPQNILRVIEGQDEFITRFSAMAIRQEDRLLEAHKEHYALVDFIEKRDLAGFQDLMERHIDRSKEMCLAALAEQRKHQNF
mgnify:CR=1 FL=1